MGVGAARLLHILKVRSGRGVQRPAFGAVLPDSLRPVERGFALTPVEAGQMAASQRHPNDSVAIDIHAARRKALHWRLGIIPRNLVVLGQSGLRWMPPRIQTNESTGESQNASPDHSIRTDPA